MKVLAITALSDLPEAHLIAGLARSGVNIELVSDERAIYHDIWETAGIANTRLRFNAKFDARAIVELRRIMRRGGYNLFHAFSNRPLTNAMAASLGLPIRRVGYCGTMGHLNRWDPASRVTFLSSRLDRIVCVSKAVKNYLLTLGLPTERLTAIYKGHDPSWYMPGPRRALATLGIPRDAFVVGCVANVRPVKGVDVLLQAALEFPAESPVHLLLIGEVRDSRVETLAADARLRERVHCTGFRDDATALLGACDVSVMPSLRNEGFPKAVMESMFQGVPAIVSDVGGLPEIVDHERTGLVVPPGNPEALAAALTFCATHPERCSEMGTAARTAADTRFHIERTVRDTIALYEAMP